MRKRLKNSRIVVRAFLLTGSATVALTAPPAAAQDVEEADEESSVIIVTATKREQSLQDVPFSINAQPRRTFRSPAP